jgi:hypothetical protein
LLLSRPVLSHLLYIRLQSCHFVQDAGSADAPGLVAEAEATLAALEQALSAWRLAALLGGPYDAGGAVVSIQVQEWASA